MLSPRDDEDDDSHLCIKCNATIVGLEHYIAHRKRRCKIKQVTSKADITIDTLEPSYSLGADVFFQSLELQSSVKKTSLSRLTPPIPISKASIDRKNALAIPSTSRDLPRMSPLETNLRGEDWIGGHSLRIGTSEDNQTKLINAVASISGAVKKELPSTSYGIGYNDFKPDDDSEESEVSDDDDDDEPHTSGGKWKPSPHHTGGKWPPVSPEHDDWELREEYTGGKWKLLLPDGIDRDEDYDAPPPGHTKGKWVPGANEKTQIMQTTIQTKGSVQYWCGPCNRRLGSRTIYEKHLRSNLHMKKVLPEQELEFSGHLEPMRNIVEKRASRPSRFLNDTIYSQLNKKKQKKTDTKLNMKIEKKKRNRKPFFVDCPGCKSRVRLHLMGKHLISHYHFRKAAGIQSNVYQQVILNYIDVIVHQSPFQCSPCKFYTNWLSNFMQHWFSEDHEQKLSSMEGRIWCSFCKFECHTSQEMLQHMSSSEHSEVVAVINRSMPIIIRKKTILNCDTCKLEFRYNIELKKHCQLTGHQLPYTATDLYQELHKCQHCRLKFKCSLTLAAHIKTKHKQKAHICLVCVKTFNSSEEAKRHRQTLEHRIKSREKIKERGVPVKDMSKKCRHCNSVLKNVLELKNHIKTVHPEVKKTCPKCGMTFVFCQEVTQHVKANACQFRPLPPGSASVVWHCSQCLFSTVSKTECFFHEVLHTTPTNEVYKVGDKEKVVQKYTCPICSKNFRKPSLRHHLRQHTFERPFRCNECGANFTRESSLHNHLKSIHQNKDESTNQLTNFSEKKKTEREQWKCRQCSKIFSDKSVLQAHAGLCALNTGTRCTYSGCEFIAGNTAQLIRHRRIHDEIVKQYKCSICTFESNRANHMKRHMLCHEAVKPYACPHCQFVCATLENLRKHVLRSGRHTGLPLYQCRLCDYSSNFAAQLREHLIISHADMYDIKSAIQAVKVLLMRNQTL